MLISHKNKFIFLKSHKTASTSTFVFFENFCEDQAVVSQIKEIKNGLVDITARNFIKKYSITKDILSGQVFGKNKPHSIKRSLKFWLRNECYFNHLNVIGLRNRIHPKVFKNYFKFTNIRNPWDIEVSAWFWFLENNIDTNELQYTFSDFVKTRKRTNIESFYKINDKIVVDDFIRYENIEIDIKKIVSKLDLKSSNIHLPKLKSGFRRNKNYRNMYDERTKDLVYKIYKNYISDFDYDF